MPYSGITDKSLPANVQKLTDEQKKKWIATFNAAYNNCKKEGGDDAACETVGFKIANGTIKKTAAEETTVLTQAFLTKLRELLGDKVDANTYNQAVRTARAHAGGKARGAKLRATGEDSGTTWGHSFITRLGELLAEKVDAEEYATIVEEASHTAGEWDDDEAVMPAMHHMGDEYKYPKADTRVNYRDATELGMTCGDCRQYMYSTCRTVEGNIERTGYCDLFIERVMNFGEQSDDAGAVVPFSTSRVFMEQSFAEPPEYMPYMPKPGVYKHPKWGSVTLTKKRNERFATNFNSGVYQKQIPVDAEHETKLSGAVGWIDSMRLNSDGSVDAHVTWNERGQSLIKADAYKYVSPEWYDEWTQPDTGKTFQDVAIGAAITTRPFFKDGSLRPLVAKEDGTLHDARTEVPGTPPVTPPNKKGAEMPDDTPTIDAKRFAEVESELTAAKAAREAAEASSKQMAERLAAIEASNRRKSFTDEVLGRSDANNIRWFGEVDKHVNLLVKMAETWGEDSEELKSYIEEQRASAKRVSTSAVFTEVGSGRGGGDGTAIGRVNQMAETMVKEGKAKSFAEAVTAIVTNDPSLYEQYNAEKGGK